MLGRVIVRVVMNFCLFLFYFLQFGDDGSGEFLEGAGSTDIDSLGSTRSDSIVDGRRDLVGMFIQVQVSQHHNTGKQHGSGVSRVLILDIKSNVTTTLKTHAHIFKNI